MATLALGVAGAVGASALGLPAGLGFAVGTYAGGLLFDEPVKQEGPRIDDLSTTTSAYGVMRPIKYGTVPIAGNIFDASDLYETRHTKKTGGGKGGGGGPTVKQTTWSYSGDLAIGLGEGPIAGVLQLVANEKLIYDESPGSQVTKPDWLQIKIYYGDETQEPDPTLEALHGVGNVPAYRGEAYIVLTRFPFDIFGTTAINFRAIVVTKGTRDNTSEYFTDSLIGSVGSFQAHPNTQIMFLVGNDTSGINGKAFNPFTKQPLFVLPRKTGGPSDNSNEAGFFSVPQVVLGETYDLGPNRHFFYGNDLGHGITVHDAYTGAFVGAVDLQYCTGSNNVAAVVIDESAGQIARICSASNNLYVYDMWNDGINFDGSTIVGTRVEEPDEALSPGDWDWNMVASYPHGTDRSGTIALFANLNHTGEDYFVTVKNGRIKAKTTDQLSNFQNPTDTNIIWDSSRQLFWVIGQESGDTNSVRLNGYSDGAGFVETHLVSGQWASIAALYYDPLDSTIWLARINNGTLYRFDTATGDWDSWGGFRSKSSWNWTGLSYHPATQTAWVVHNQTDEIVQHKPDQLSETSTTLDDVVSDLYQRAGLSVSDFDVTGLSSTVVRGYRIGRPASILNIGAPLSSAYLYDVVDTGNKLKCVVRGNSSVLTLDSQDLGAREISGELSEPLPLIKMRRLQEIEIPAEVTVSYLNPVANYERGTQAARRLASLENQKRQIEFPIVFSDDEAAQLAEVLLHVLQMERIEYKAKTHLGNLAIEGADVITLEDDNDSYNVRVTSPVLAMPLIELTALREYDVYTSTAVGAVGIDHTSEVSYAGPTILLLLDIPILRDKDDDAGFYVAASSYQTSWPGCGIFRSVDLITYEQVDSIANQATFGFVQGAGGTGPVYIWDEALSITVSITSGELTSCTDEECLNEQNAAVWGSEGRWELVLFRDVVDNGDDTYTLSRFVRGVRGTEWAMGLHQAGDRFLLLEEDTVQRMGVQSSEIGQLFYYKGVTVGHTVDESASAEQLLIPAAVGLKPWAPVHIEITGFGGDITISWERQDRIKAAPFQQPAMSEDTEEYEVDIMSGTTVKRILTVSAATSVTYTSAQQTTDFGAPVSTLEVNGYQMSDVVGRGYPGNESV